MVEAVRHAQAAKDSSLAARLLSDHTPGLALGGQSAPAHGTWGGHASEGKRLTDPLTDSEARVLRYLPTNLSAPEIARQLSVSVNTVRTHMRHVYEKLGAHRRTGAVERARALGLLAPSHAGPDAPRAGLRPVAIEATINL